MFFFFFPCCYLTLTDPIPLFQVKCGTEWRRFSARFGDEGASASESQRGKSENRMLLYMAYALSRRPPPDVLQSNTSVLTVSIKTPRLPNPVPDVSIEFAEMPTRHTLVNQWGKVGDDDEGSNGSNWKQWKGRNNFQLRCPFVSVYLTVFVCDF